MADNQYVFIPGDQCSYRVSDLRKYLEMLVTIRVPGAKITTPGGTTIDSSCFNGNMPLASKVDLYMKIYTFKDYSMTSDQKECTITFEKFQEPYFITDTGRAYERVAIIECIKTTYLAGKQLRLESGKPIDPINDSIILHPHKNLGCRSDKIIEYHPKDVKWPEFREGSQRIVEGLTKIINDTQHGCDEYIYDAETVYRYYCTKRGIQPADRYGEKQIKDTLIRDARLFNVGHVKAGLVFINTEFRNCVINAECWCGIKFISCRFTDCRIEKLSTLRIFDMSFRRCVWIGTRFTNGQTEAAFKKLRDQCNMTVLSEDEEEEPDLEDI